MEKHEIETANDGSRDAAAREKWLQTWEKVGRRILNLPLWMQEILLEDLNTAVVNRVTTMEMIENAQRKH